jgi:anaerobic dimethyl sulfoxide reductase subunit B (iron-sulfur subunit)
MMAKRYGFHINSASCTGCKACQIACKEKNQLPVGILWRRVVEVSGGGWERKDQAWIDNTFTYFLSVACMHCERPICVGVCPTRALVQREDGIVLIDEERCMGCHYCEWACPYGAPQYDQERGVMTKCDFCQDYLEQGKPPACVSACQMRVLEFGDIQDLRTKYGPFSNVFPLPELSLTEPSGTLTPHYDSQRTINEPASIGNREEI